MTHPQEPEPLRPMLKATQKDLARHLDEACAHDVTEESTAQLMRLEETLVEAAQAAKQAVSLRRRLRTGHGPADLPDRSGEDDSANDAPDQRPAVERRANQGPVQATSDSVREFRDARGILWRVWAVQPGHMNPERIATHQLGQYSEGWLAFEADDGTQRRRLPHHPEDWAHRSNHALELLLEDAEVVRVRRHTADDRDATQG